MKNYPFTSWITKEQDSFNAYLNKGRVVVEMAFGHLKGRWRRLTKKIEVEVKFAPVIIAACCVLHNIVEFNKEHFPEDWMRIVQSHCTEFPQPGPSDDDTTARPLVELEDGDGEIVRNALLEVSKQLPVLSSISWRLKKY